MNSNYDAYSKIGYQLTGGDSHVKSREDRIAQTPTKNVRWDGRRGESRCYPTDAKTRRLLKKYGQTYVAYDRTGEPNFTPYADASVRISDMSTDRQRNFSSAGRELLKTDWAKERKITTLSELDSYKTKHNLTWHECGDGVTMQLVPTEVNAKFGHSGGVAEYGAMEKNLSISKDGLLRTLGSEHGKAKIKAKKQLVKVESGVNEVGRKINDILPNEPISKVNDVLSTMEDVGNDIATGAGDALVGAAFPLMVLGVQNICEVASGQKTLEEAGKEMGQTGARIAISGGGVKIAEKAAIELTEKSGSELLKKLVGNSNEIMQLANVSMLVMDSFVKLVNDEITGSEFFDEIGEKGSMLVGDLIGTFVGAGFVDLLLPASVAAGPAGVAIGAGAFIGGMIVSTVCVGIYNYTRNLRIQYESMGREYRRKIVELNNIADEALIEMQYQQDMLKDMIQTEYSEWEDHFSKGYEMVIDAMMSNNFEKLAGGLDTILKVFGQTVIFNNMDEFDEFFFDDVAVLTL